MIKGRDVRGTVLDARSQAPVAEAQVTWVDHDQTVKTDARGKFSFAGTQATKHVMPFADVGVNATVIDTFVIMHPGHAVKKVENRRLKHGEVCVDLGNILLKPA